MTMLMEESTFHDGKHAEPLCKAVDWMIAQCRPNGLLASPAEQETLYMFAHGYAMLFLATVYGEEPESDRRRTLEKILNRAVEFTAFAQTKEGGWGYVASVAGNHFDESASTVCQLQALRAARN